MKKNPFVSKEISWLNFNERVLQEASSTDVPALERLKFLGIFSANMDEFFRVRVATLHRLVKVRKKAIQLIGQDPREILAEIKKIVQEQTERFEQLYQEILADLKHEGIVLRCDASLSEAQRDFVMDYFHRKVRPFLVPLMLNNKTALLMKDHPIYLAVSLEIEDGAEPDYALIEIPTDKVSRFLILPSEQNLTEIILLEDIIRLGMDEIFFYFKYSGFSSYIVKITRDSELDMDDERFKTFPQKVQDGLARRKTGRPVRFVYDRTIPDTFLEHLCEVLHIHDPGARLPGGRYHNFKDFIGFPQLPRPELYYDPFKPLPHPQLEQHQSVMDQIATRDILLHFPYHSFDHFIDLLREAAIDPRVSTIRLTVYRLARDSQIVNALVNAAQNGKKVF
ncbi:MAG: polyphosphate kinase 1, partial [Geobacteraceae bacterium]|nr:polyphosphate kinase 1 [Geobacteraceae bacterium]